MRPAAFTLIATCITLAPADIARGQSHDTPVMEIVSFRLNTGVTDAAFLAAAEQTRVMVAAQPGFVRRSLLRDRDGVWTDMIVWQSLPNAKAAADIVVADPSFAAFGAAIDMSTLQMNHTPIAWQMEN
jgi:hypothetical protein